MSGPTWVFPRGMKRSGQAGPNSISGRPKHGSVIASGYNISTTGGMNEAGLVANVFVAGRVLVPRIRWQDTRADPGRLGAILLDNFASVREAVDTLASDRSPSSRTMPGEQPTTCPSVLVRTPAATAPIIDIYRRQTGHPTTTAPTR